MHMCCITESLLFLLMLLHTALLSFCFDSRLLLFDASCEFSCWLVDCNGLLACLVDVMNLNITLMKPRPLILVAVPWCQGAH